MKQKIILLSFLVLVLFSCDESVTIGFDADFVADIDVESTEQTVSGVASKSTKMNGFNGSVVLRLEDEEAIADYLERIKEVNIQKVQCEIIGLSEGKKVESLQIQIDSTTFDKTVYDIDELNNIFDIDVSDEVLSEVGTTFFKNKTLKVMVKGITSHAPMRFKVKVRFKSKVRAAAL